MMESMKEVVVVRHANWDFVHDKLNEEGQRHCVEIKPSLGSFSIVVSPSFIRSQETARAISEKNPLIDERAGVLKISPEYMQQITELRKSNPLGVAGAIISISELREPLRTQGQLLMTLVEELLMKLADNEKALIVSHDGTMVALEKILNNEPFDTINHTFGELEGFRVSEELVVSVL